MSTELIDFRISGTKEKWKQFTDMLREPIPRNCMIALADEIDRAVSDNSVPDQPVNVLGGFFSEN